MKVRMTKKWLSMALAFAVTTGSLVMGGAAGQEKKDDKKPPVLPPTKVEGTPTTPTTPAPEPLPPDVPTLGNPILNGGVFGSPPVDGYRAGSASTGSKVDMPLIDYPGAITVIPKDIIKDQSILNVDDLLRNIPGANKQSDFGNLRGTAFILRGFEVGSRDFRWNGFTDPSYARRDFANIERVEVMSGPASVLYGAVSPAGLINFITKKPLATPYNNVEYTFGSYNLSRIAVDSTGPIDVEGRFLYRANAAYQQSDSFRDFGWEQRTIAAPVFQFLIDPDTVLTLEGSYQDSRRNLDTGLIYFNKQFQGPINRSFNEPGDRISVADYKTYISLDRRFDENLSGRISFFTDSYTTDMYGTMPSISSTNSFNNGIAPRFGLPKLGATEILRQTRTFHLDEHFYDLRGELNAKFDGVLLKHNVVVGAEVGWYHSDFRGRNSDPTGGVPFGAAAPIPAANIFNFANPVYNQVGNIPLPGSSAAFIDQERYGVYLSDAMELNEKWKFLAGFRYDAVNSRVNNSATFANFGLSSGSFPNIRNDRVDYRISPRVGIVYQPIPETLALYGAYTQSFDPPLTGLFTTPTPLKPETGTSYEIGAKLDLFEKWLTIQGAGYITTKQNVIAQESLITNTQLGEIRSTGAEFSVIGKLTELWSVIGTYAYTDSRIIAGASTDSAIKSGNLFRNVPYNTFNIWTRYNLIDNERHTFGVGLGLVYVGDRMGDLDNTFSLPSYTRWDAGVFYKRGRWNASVYMENLGNREYFSGSYDNTTILPGTPFNVRASLGVTF